MAETHELLHQEDNITLTENFDFSQSIFDLEEPNFAPLGSNFVTPTSTYNYSSLSWF